MTFLSLWLYVFVGPWIEKKCFPLWTASVLIGISQPATKANVERHGAGLDTSWVSLLLPGCHWLDLQNRAKTWAKWWICLGNLKKGCGIMYTPENQCQPHTQGDWICFSFSTVSYFSYGLVFCRPQVPSLPLADCSTSCILTYFIIFWFGFGDCNRFYGFTHTNTHTHLHLMRFLIWSGRRKDGIRPSCCETILGLSSCYMLYHFMSYLAFWMIWITNIDTVMFHVHTPQAPNPKKVFATINLSLFFFCCLFL